MFGRSPESGIVARPTRSAMSERSRLLTGEVTYSRMPTELTTERFILTPEELADAEWLADLFTARGGGTVTEVRARVRIAAMHELMRAHGIGAYVLRPRDGGTPMGYAAIILGRGTLEEPELVYELGPKAYRRGYATETARVVLDAAFATGRRQIWATVRTWNAASLRVLDKLGGFRQERGTHDVGRCGAASLVRVRGAGRLNLHRRCIPASVAALSTADPHDSTDGNHHLQVPRAVAESSACGGRERK
jgi:RimJ/RimL family protein N-acetyltransferase